MLSYPKVKAVESLPDKQLRVTFADGTVKCYNCQPLLTELSFRLLSDDAFFQTVQVDRHGYGVVWNDDVDLAESELWLHGTLEPEILTEHRGLLLD